MRRGDCGDCVGECVLVADEPSPPPAGAEADGVHDGDVDGVAVAEGSVVVVDPAGNGGCEDGDSPCVCGAAVAWYVAERSCASLAEP